jgi:hypothetical protein
MFDHEAADGALYWLNDCDIIISAGPSQAA